MIVVRGRQTEQMGAAALHALTAPYAGVTIDVGAGDGRFAYAFAKANPERFIIALDPVRENVREMSAKAARKPERGGVANLLYVAGAIERPPEELRGTAGEVLVTLPWGSLMRGIILADETVLRGIASFAADGALLRIVLNTRIFDDPVPLEARDLPEVTPAYVTKTLAPAFAKHGLRITDTRELTADGVAALNTTWAKRLSHRRPPPSVLIEATRARVSSDDD